MKYGFFKFIAFLFGTFVTTCPKCYGYFFGFQKYGTQIKIDHVIYRIICPECMKQADLIEQYTVL